MSMKDSGSLSKKLGIIGIGLCAACCLLPIVAVTFGVGALAAIGAYIEWLGIFSMVAAILLLGIYLFNKRRAPSCDVDCECKGDKTASQKIDG
jgi:hypothetical protein